MRIIFHSVLSGAVALLALPQLTSAAPPIRKTADEYVIEQEENVANASDAAAQLTIAQSAENKGSTKRAIKAYRKVVKRFPKTPQAQDAQYKVGELYEQQGKLSNAFDAYQKLIDAYPGTKNFDKAVESQYKIATLYLDGKRQKLLGIPTLPSMEKAEKMFETIVKNAPYTRFAPLSQFNIGQALEKQAKLAEAILAYQIVLDRYPNSDVADDAQYQIAYVYFNESRHGSYDRTVAEKANEAFQDFLLRYPDSEKSAQAEENLKLLEGRSTEGAFEIAQFYDKQKQYRAAVIYYNEVLRQQPDSAESEKSQQRIDDIRALVGDDALQSGPERAMSGETGNARRRLQAQVDTSARPDYVGPPAPPIPDELPPERPKLRTSVTDVAPLMPDAEPELPAQ